MADRVNLWAAVILYFRRGPAVWETVNKIADQDPAPSEIILVDNNSEDGYLTQELARRHGVTLVSLPENRGYAGGMNSGLDVSAESEWVLLSTHDSQLPPLAVRHFLDTADSSPRCSALGPVIEVDGETWSTGGTLTSRGPRHETNVPSKPTPVDWLDGCCVFTRRSALTKVGGIDERYFLYWEDVDLGTALKKVGPVLVVPAVRVSQETAFTPIYFSARNEILYWRKHERYALAIRATLKSLVKMTTRDVGRRSEATLARLRGVRDGWTGTLSRPVSMVREAKI